LGRWKILFNQTDAGMVTVDRADLERSISGKGHILVLGFWSFYLHVSQRFTKGGVPFILLGKPMAIGADRADFLAIGSNHVICQTRLVDEMGFCKETPILIVEFAEQLRRKGRSIATLPSRQASCGCGPF